MVSSRLRLLADAIWHIPLQTAAAKSLRLNCREARPCRSSSSSRYARINGSTRIEVEPTGPLLGIRIRTLGVHRKTPSVWCLYQVKH